MEKPRKKISFYRHVLFGMFFAVTFSAAFHSALQVLLQSYFKGSYLSVNVSNGPVKISISDRRAVSDKGPQDFASGVAGTEETSVESKVAARSDKDSKPFVEAGNKENSGRPKRGVIMVGAGFSGLIYIVIFIWFILRIKPIYNFTVKGVESERLVAIDRFNGIYKTICAYFIILMLINFCREFIAFYKYASFSIADFMLYNALPSAFGCYYGIYFSIIYLEPFLFTKVADIFYSGADLYTKKEGLQLSLRTRLFMTILNLLVIPMIIIVCFAFLIPEADIEGIIAANNISKLKEIFYPILISKYNLLAIAFISLCYAIGYIEMLYRSIQRPIDELVKKMERLAGGDFNVKTTVLSSDEIGKLKYNFNLMIDGLTDREKLRETFGKYVSIEIAKHLIETNKIDLGGEDINATVLFSDIRNFTSMSEKMTAREVVDFLNEYFSYISEPIIQNHGVINKFIGDAVMAIYSPHLGSENHVADAVKSAVGMREKLKEFNSSKKYGFEVRFGVGIHTGILVAGNIGTKSRLEYTVIGDTVNVASRIETENKSFGSDILVSESVIENLDNDLKSSINTEKCPPISVKGKEKPVLLYKIL
ncbi:MAG: Adenylate cyclase 1 [bacterium ADurb.Bin243]|nr:MAG: Adenylate cyclase 1 [bacterium ADurb.Bin243]